MIKYFSQVNGAYLKKLLLKITNFTGLLFSVPSQELYLFPELCHAAPRRRGQISRRNSWTQPARNNLFDTEVQSIVSQNGWMNFRVQ